MSPSRSPLPEEDGPTFEPSVHWCARHLEPFRETWGKDASWPKATVGLMYEMIARDEIKRACGWRGQAGTAEPQMLDRVLREFSPMCCFVGDEATEKWTRLAQGPTEEFRAAIEEVKGS